MTFHLPYGSSHLPYECDADNWHPGKVMAVYHEHKVPQLPIDVDRLMFQTCSMNVLDLTGLDDDCLEHLSLIGCRVRRITNIPPSVKYLSIQYSSLEELPDLPSGLVSLRLDTIQSLDTEVLPPLPSTLTELVIVDVNIRLCETLPPRLTRLACDSMSLTSLPSVLPPTLFELSCAKNRISVLPDVLPPSLVYLNCSSNQLESLPAALPTGLRVLHCAKNRIRVLPSLPKSLRTLDFSVNPIETYPYIGKHMYVKISRHGEYFQAIMADQPGQAVKLRNGMTVFSPSIDDVPFIDDDEYANMMYIENGYEESDILNCVYEIQRQVHGRAFLAAIKEELIAATWHPRRVEAWCGVDFSDPDSD